MILQWTGWQNYFNPRSHEGSDAAVQRRTGSHWDFNPRSHEGSDDLTAGRRGVCRGISIHAPTRGATLPELQQRCWEFISIHAPTRGATKSDPVGTSKVLFQSTLPRGERRLPPRSERQNLFYFNPRSHEGSDMQCYITILIARRFQSTLPRGERRRCFLWLALGNLFQSTLPRGERRHSISSGHYQIYFNPRSHEGSDDQSRQLQELIQISIHAPTRGATADFKVTCKALLDFNPRSHEGSDGAQDVGFTGVVPISIHAPTWGATTNFVILHI